MINFFYETDFCLSDESLYKNWINRVVFSEDKSVSELNFIFCNDEYMLEINQKYLNHDTYTDIITFDYSVGNILQGDVYMSIERILENADVFNVTFEDELLRVMSHGVLHLSGFKDKTVSESKIMRYKENEKIKMFHVEQ